VRRATIIQCWDQDSAMSSDRAAAKRALCNMSSWADAIDKILFRVPRVVQVTSWP
jgi:hypothetical protein